MVQAAVLRFRWPDDPEYLKSIEEHWVEPLSDMRQELVFISRGLDETHIRVAVDDCLLTEDELLRGKHIWVTLPDPFPAWQESA